MNRRLFLSMAAAGVASCVLTARAAAEDAALEFGVFPYLSARSLLNSYQPLKGYLEEHLGRKVLFSTAPNFQTFHERTLKGEYDLVLTPPHFARYAQMASGYVPTGVFSRILRCVVAVRKGPGITQVSDLRGKTVVVPDRYAIVTLLGLGFLAGHGLRPDIDFKLQVSNSHASAAYAVANAEGDAAITEVAAFQRQIPDEARNQLRIAFMAGNLPHIMFLAHPRLGAARIATIHQTLLNFASKSPEGRAYIENSGFEGIRSVTEADMKTMDPFVAELKALGL